MLSIFFSIAWHSSEESKSHHKLTLLRINGIPVLKDQTSSDPSKKTYKEELERDLKTAQHTMNALTQMERMLQTKQEKSKKTLELLSYMEQVLQFKTAYYADKARNQNGFQQLGSTQILSVVSFFLHFTDNLYGLLWSHYISHLKIYLSEPKSCFHEIQR